MKHIEATAEEVSEMINALAEKCTLLEAVLDMAVEEIEFRAGQISEFGETNTDSAFLLGTGSGLSDLAFSIKNRLTTVTRPGDHTTEPRSES